MGCMPKLGILYFSKRAPVQLAPSQILHVSVNSDSTKYFQNNSTVIENEWKVYGVFCSSTYTLTYLVLTYSLTYSHTYYVHVVRIVVRASCSVEVLQSSDSEESRRPPSFKCLQICFQGSSLFKMFKLYASAANTKNILVNDY